MNERITYFDLLRGLAIIGVVAIHSSGIGYTFEDTSVDFNLQVLWRQVINFSVPMFIAISGYFLANKDVSTKNAYFKFIKKQVPRVLVPYLIWSVLYLGISYLRGAAFSSLIYRLLTFSSSIPFYFVILIIEYYLLLPILKKLATSKGIIISALISGFSCLLIFYIRYYTQIKLPMILLGSAPSFLVFFVVGIYLRHNTISFGKSKLFLLMISALALSMVETYLLYYSFKDIGSSVTQIKISSFIYSGFVILFAFKYSERVFTRTKLLSYIGEVSFGIFLSHWLFIVGLRKLIDIQAPILKENAILYQFTLVALTLGCCLIFAFITRKFNKEKAVKYLGQ